LLLLSSMRSEASAWIQQAKEDYETARFNQNGGKHKIAAFLCQQAAEKALKAYLIEKEGQLHKIHDLVALGKVSGISSPLIERLSELTLAYVYTRYPDVRPEMDLKDKIPQFLETAQEVLTWTEKQLSKKN